jgi:hypothetical protein
VLTETILKVLEIEHVKKSRHKHGLSYSKKLSNGSMLYYVRQNGEDG